MFGGANLCLMYVAIVGLIDWRMRFCIDISKEQRRRSTNCT